MLVREKNNFRQSSKRIFFPNYFFFSLRVWTPQNYIYIYIILLCFETLIYREKNKIQKGIPLRFDNCIKFHFPCNFYLKKQYVTESIHIIEKYWNPGFRFQVTVLLLLTWVRIKATDTNLIRSLDGGIEASKQSAGSSHDFGGFDRPGAKAVETPRGILLPRVPLSLEWLEENDIVVQGP